MSHVFICCLQRGILVYKAITPLKSIRKEKFGKVEVPPTSSTSLGGSRWPDPAVYPFLPIVREVQLFYEGSLVQNSNFAEICFCSSYGL